MPSRGMHELKCTLEMDKFTHSQFFTWFWFEFRIDGLRLWNREQKTESNRDERELLKLKRMFYFEVEPKNIL